MTAISLLSGLPVEKGSSPLRAVLVGGSGQIGTLLARHFHVSGKEVTIMARRPIIRPWKSVPWDGLQLGDWVDALDGVDVVIKLAGRSVDCRYTNQDKSEIFHSRVQTTELAGKAIETLRKPPAVCLDASTAPIYRHAMDTPIDEAADKLAGAQPGVPQLWRSSREVAKRWGESFFSASPPYTRKIALCTAMTMSPDKRGLFDVLLRLVRFGDGGRFGSGTQYVSWIHERDFVRAIEFLIEHESISGAVNVAAPDPLASSEFMRHLRAAWGIRFGLPVHQWMLEVGAVFLRTEIELVLKSRRVVPGAQLEEGFKFDFRTGHTRRRILFGSGASDEKENHGNERKPGIEVGFFGSG